LKSQRAETGAMLTLFTGEAGLRELSDVEMVKRYGYVNGEGRRALKVTITSHNLMPQGLKLAADRRTKRVMIVDRHGTAPWAWDFGAIKLKLGQLVYVKAETRGRGSAEQFHYNWAVLLSGLDVDRFFGLIESGEILVDLRVHLNPNGSARNHGTAFRIREFGRLQGCYRTVCELLPDC